MPHISRSSFKARGIFRNRHFSTIWPALFRRVQVSYERQRIHTPDGDFFDTDTLINQNKHAAILLHGLEGSTFSNYIKGMAQHLSVKGYDVYAINFRSCSGTPNTKLQSYHSGFTDDLRFFINRLVATSSYQGIHLCGFSLGGNVLLKYLAEEHKKTDPSIRSAVAVSAPVDLRACADTLALHENRVYMNRFLKSLSQKVRQKASVFPGSIDLENIGQIKNFEEFDNRYTAPIHGFKDAFDYWKKCSSLPSLDLISIPTLLVNALNDPFLSASCFPSPVLNPLIYTEYPSHGGHVGFSRSFFGSSWIEPRTAAFFDQFR